MNLAHKNYQSMAVAFASAIIFLIGSVSSQDQAAKKVAVDTTAQIVPSYTIRIDSINFNPQQEVDTVAVWSSPSDDNLAGFSLKLALDHPNLEILEIIPGEIIDSCGWELFTPRSLSAASTAEEPDQIWFVVGLAKASANKSEPICLGFDREAILFNIVLGYQSTPGPDRSNAPIFFYWQDCRDNILTDESGGALSISESVLNHSGAAIESKEIDFPNRSGTPASCIKTNLKNHPVRSVLFRNGLIRFP